MATFNGDASASYVPIVIGNVNYKTLAKNFAYNKADSVTVKGDSIFYFTNGVRYFSGRVPASGGKELKVVATESDRNNIPLAERFPGMIVYVTSENKHYTLKGGTTNGDWVEFSEGGSINITGGGGILIDNF